VYSLKRGSKCVISGLFNVSLVLFFGGSCIRSANSLAEKWLRTKMSDSETEGSLCSGSLVVRRLSDVDWSSEW